MSSTPAISTDLDTLLAGSPYVAYCYGYPHKTAYRPFDPPQLLSGVWAGESRESLFLYLHVPFCEVRCGFCNLFTLARPEASLPEQYLAALRRQAEATIDAIAPARFTRLAIGGGTPTFLSAGELESLLRIVTEVLGAPLGEIPFSCEASPATLSAEKLALLRAAGVTRLSLGIQSFDPADAHAMGRPQDAKQVDEALALVRQSGIPTVNLDLIYGGESQTRGSWLASIDQAVDYAAEEIYLYPLYVRPLTGLFRLAHQWDDWRLALYRAGRDRLLSRGYEQVSMRMFRRPESGEPAGPVYCCQDDGMVGLGCGARSYTRTLHYASEYAVVTRAVAGILADYLRRTAADFRFADYGITLSDDDERRRLVILSLLQADGLDRGHYARRFGTDALNDLPQLSDLAERELATIDSALIRLTPEGLAWSDAIGPWLYSSRVRRRMEEYAWR
jgi:oxygen-independent coproporphyrinogen-3 oxidase